MSDEPDSSPPLWRVTWRCPVCGTEIDEKGIEGMPPGTRVIELVCARCTDRKATFYDCVFKAE